MKNTEIISATKARELTIESIENDDKCLIPIMNKIKEAIKKKQYYCYIAGSTSEYVIDKLHTLGYKTKFIQGDFRDPRETDVYEITW